MVTRMGLVGLGKMGANMRARLRAGGITVIGYDPRPEVSDVPTLTALVAALDQVPDGDTTPVDDAAAHPGAPAHPGAAPTPRIVWVMVPAGEPTRAVMTDLGGLLRAGDIVIDGGNSHYVEDQERAAVLAECGIGYIDAGVSGGVRGQEFGYGLMVGGDPQQVNTAMPVFDALRPDGPRDEGFVHAGPAGAGHFAKMVHNGIEYGLMQAYAEGYEMMAAHPLIQDVAATMKAWQRGTVVRSWLLDLFVAALEVDPDLAGIDGWVDDSGEGRWTLEAAIDAAVPLPVISAALFARFASRQEVSPAMKAVAALRQQFGGHGVRPAAPTGLPPTPRD